MSHLTATQQRIVEAAWDRLDEFGDEDRRAVAYAVDQLVLGRNPATLKPGASTTVAGEDADFLINALRDRLRRFGDLDTDGTLTS